MPVHARIFWGRANGRIRVNVNWSAIRRDSVVVVTASEGIEPITTVEPRRFVADADFTVRNVAPRDGAVTFIVTIDWGEPLNLYTDITVFDPSDRLVNVIMP